MNIVVVGGGTAGWLTALYANRVFPKDQITLIESDEIGILGAGEGTTPNLLPLFDFLGIPALELIRETGATVKNGIKFSNWDRNGSYYYHSFLSNSVNSNDYNFSYNKYLEIDTAFCHIYGHEYGHELKEYSFMHKLCDNHQVPFIIDEVGFSTEANWAIHFNARRIAAFLRSVGESRGIRRIEGIVSKIDSDVNGYITKLSFERGEIDVDFVFDASGFARELIGKHFKSEWKSHSTHLPAKKAIPFFLPLEEDLPPYTESTALNYGWMWKIPTQDRYGCGYVFDSDFITEDEAHQELTDLLGGPVDSPKTFNFNAGCYTTPWVKNCLAVGLSAGFIEPLEATSLSQIAIVLERFLSDPTNIVSKNETIIKKFNQDYLDDTQEVVDFLYTHYITNKVNTPFWEDFTKNNVMPEFVSYILDVYKDRPFVPEDFKGRNMFATYSYTYILLGNGLLTPEIREKHTRFVRLDKSLEYFSILKNQTKNLPLFSTHKDFIRKSLGG
jgi:tryptophan halogenase